MKIERATDAGTAVLNLVLECTQLYGVHRWYRLDFEFRTNERKPGLSGNGSQDTVVCYQVAKLHTTMWQSPIKVAGADHAV
jgi:hypothetical protein